jgi:hypothetical protein
MEQPYFPPWPQMFTRIECGGSVQDEHIASSVLALIYQSIFQL